MINLLSFHYWTWIAQVFRRTVKLVHAKDNEISALSCDVMLHDTHVTLLVILVFVAVCWPMISTVFATSLDYFTVCRQGFPKCFFSPRHGVLVGTGWVVRIGCRWIRPRRFMGWSSVKWLQKQNPLKQQINERKFLNNILPEILVASLTKRRGSIQSKWYDSCLSLVQSN